MKILGQKQGQKQDSLAKQVMGQVVLYCLEVMVVKRVKHLPGMRR